VAGNVGTAASSLVSSLEPGRTVVCEASSFQLEDTERFSPEAAVLLNLAPDHLDRHASYEQYVAAKLKVFANQDRDDVAVMPVDLGIGELPGEARRVLFGPGLPPELEPLVGRGELSLPGEHNRQNAMAAAAVCLARGLDVEAVAAGLRTFKGVAHRLELVAVRGGVSYVNDSKATNVASTVVGLRAYRNGVHLIAGGRGKLQAFAPLAPLVAEHCRAVYLIGEAAGELAGALKDTGVPLHVMRELVDALPAARDAAQPGEVVLFSPACASYDQYSDFEARGEHFRSLVEGP
jgi:UDP-N-acetylmuramoylalanine--D-glutamate ligase